MTNKLNSLKGIVYSSLFAFALVVMLIYLFVRIWLTLTSHPTPLGVVLAIILLSAECFILIHSIGYFLNIFRVVKDNAGFTPQIKIPKLVTLPSVAIVVASYKEPIHVLKDTLVCFYNLDYPNRQLYFLDDTRYDQPWDTEENKQKYRHEIDELCKTYEVNVFRSPWHGAKAGKINDFVKFMSRNPVPGTEYTHNGRRPLGEPENYLIIFDADMNPLPDFVGQLVAIMEANPKLAFTQTPQYYSNFEFNRVARAAGLQQAVFYEYICEGKGQQGAMFCCGSNVIIRRQALEEVGGFDETSVTEDFVTSLLMHKKGWSSRYLSVISAFGQGPEDLGAFFKQQFRWARGTLGCIVPLLKNLVKSPRDYTLSQWWEHFLTATTYLNGTVYIIMVFFPILYILFDQPSFISDPLIYVCTFVPYITLTLVLFVLTLRKRNYAAKDIASVLVMNAVTFPVFVKAAFAALFNVKSTFGVTPKDGATSLPLTAFKPQIAAALLCVIATTWGIMSLIYEDYRFYGILANLIWTTYNFMVITSFLYFNGTEEDPDSIKS